MKTGRACEFSGNLSLAPNCGQRRLTKKLDRCARCGPMIVGQDRLLRGGDMRRLLYWIIALSAAMSASHVRAQYQVGAEDVLVWDTQLKGSAETGQNAFR